jgi:hypothetical protein
VFLRNAQACFTDIKLFPGFNFISPAAVFSSCWIFNSASASFSWQIFTSRVPSSYLRQQRFQRQIAGFHGLDNALELFQSLFKRQDCPFGRVIGPGWF